MIPRARLCSVVACLVLVGAGIGSQEGATATTDLEHAVRTAGEEHGERSPEMAGALTRLAYRHYADGDLRSALPLLLRAMSINEEVHGLEHAITAENANDLGLIHSRLGNYDKARPLLERALAVRERVFGPEHPATSQSLNNLSGVYWKTADFDSARVLLERALAIQEKALGPGHPATATALSNLAVVLEEMGDLSAALPPAERALAINEESLGPDHVGTVASLTTLASILDGLSDYEAALPMLERALAIRERSLGPMHPDTSGSLNALAALHSRLGDYEVARPLFERALTIREHAFGPEHPRTAETLGQLAALLRDTGDYEAARPLFERALAANERSLGPDHPRTASALGQLASVLFQLGELGAARELFERALRIREAVLGAEDPRTAGSLNDLAGLLSTMGDFEAARPLCERALAIRERVLGPDHVATVDTLHMYGVLLLDAGDHDSARPVLERVVASREEIFGEAHPSTVTSMNNLALVLERSGELDAALRLHERALVARETTLGSEHSLTATSLNNLAVLLRRTGDYERARDLCERAVASRQSLFGPDHPETVRARNNLAIVLADLGDARGAWEVAARALAGHARFVSRELRAQSEHERFEFLASARQGVRTALVISDLLGEPEVTAEAYDALLAWQGAVARTVSAGRKKLQESLTPEQESWIEELRAVQAQISKQLYDDEPSRERQERLTELRERRNRLELDLQRSLENAGGVRVADCAELSRSIPSNAATLGFFIEERYVPARWEGGVPVEKGRWTAPHVQAWVMRRSEAAPVRVDLGEAEGIERLVRAHLASIIESGDAVRGLTREVPRANEADAGAELARALWAPIAPYIRGAERLIIAPDSFLATLPFETLSFDGAFLIERFAVSYVHDLGSLAERVPGKRSGGTSSLLAVGGVDFGSAEDRTGVEGGAAHGASRTAFGDGWAPLPGTVSEVRAIHGLHGNARPDTQRIVLFGTAPTEERLKRELGRFGVLHIATHGFFNPDGLPSMWESALNAVSETGGVLREQERRIIGNHPGLLSGLVCSGANGDATGRVDDGLLTAEEVGWLDLDGAELVVLSACETGLGRARSGEGLLGLRRSFRMAGADTVVSSLWQVKDESTSRLMQRFYENLWREGMGTHDALRSAQLAMLHENVRIHGHALPSTWGAFVLDGDWR